MNSYKIHSGLTSVPEQYTTAQLVNVDTSGPCFYVLDIHLLFYIHGLLVTVIMFSSIKSMCEQTNINNELR